MRYFRLSAFLFCGALFALFLSACGGGGSGSGASASPDGGGGGANSLVTFSGVDMKVSDRITVIARGGSFLPGVVWVGELGEDDPRLKVVGEEEDFLFGDIASANMVLTMTLDTDEFEVTILPNNEGISVNGWGGKSGELKVDADRYSVFSYYSDHHSEEDDPHHAHFLAAEYVAIGLLYEGDMDTRSAGNYYFGLHTPPNALPTSGRVDYDIDHVIGVETDGTEALVGDGSLFADFASGKINLSLDVNTIDGGDWVDIEFSGLGLEKGNERNKFVIPDDGSMTYEFDYADGVGFDDFADAATDADPQCAGHDFIDTCVFVEGAFFGPEYEEVGGVIDDIGGGDLMIQFIGKKKE